MALILENDGTIRHEPYRGEAWLRKLVCPESNILEPVRIMDGVSMWGDEESKCRMGHEVNISASLIYRALYGGDYMAGTVVVLGDDGHGNSIDLGFPMEFAISIKLGELQRLYEDGKLGPRFEATGPRLEIRELTAEEFERMFGKGADHGEE